MAKLDYNKLIKIKESNIKILSIKDFIDQYHDGLTPEAIHYAITNDKIDYCMPFDGRERFIVTTEKTLEYNPISSPKRSRIGF